MNRNAKTPAALIRRVSHLTPTQLQPFNLVVIYDEENVAMASEAIILRLLKKCLPLLDIHKDEWSFAELGHVEFAKEAVELAANCDMLAVATSDDQHLSSTVISWLSRWMESRAKG